MSKLFERCVTPGHVRLRRITLQLLPARAAPSSCCKTRVRPSLPPQRCLRKALHRNLFCRYFFFVHKFCFLPNKSSSSHPYSVASCIFLECSKAILFFPPFLIPYNSHHVSSPSFPAKKFRRRCCNSFCPSERSTS